MAIDKNRLQGLIQKTSGQQGQENDKKVGKEATNPSSINIFGGANQNTKGVNASTNIFAKGAQATQPTQPKQNTQGSIFGQQAQSNTNNKPFVITKTPIEEISEEFCFDGKCYKYKMFPTKMGDRAVISSVINKYTFVLGYHDADNSLLFAIAVDRKPLVPKIEHTHKKIDFQHFFTSADLEDFKICLSEMEKKYDYH